LSVPFPRTLRSLRDDGEHRVLLALSAAAALLSLWAAWFWGARLSVYERSERARVEVDGAAQVIEAPVSGRVAAVHLMLGQAVRAGDVLVQLDATAQQLALEEAQRRRGAALAQLEFLRAELAATELATRENRSAAQAAVDEAVANRRAAEERVSIAREEAERLAVLRGAGHVGELEQLRAAVEAETRRAAAQASALGVERIDWTQRTNASDRLAALVRLRRDSATLEADVAAAAGEIELQRYEIERRTIVTPVAGRIGELTVLKNLSFVREGDRLATVVPPGQLRVVAEFAPATAVGRVRRGQAARVRLTGFSWAEFGTLVATVSNVASEAQAGRVRAELELSAGAPDAIPLQHGLVAMVDVEVERTSPAVLFLRASGQYLGAPAPPPEPPEPEGAQIGLAR